MNQNYNTITAETINMKNILPSEYFNNNDEKKYDIKAPRFEVVSRFAGSAQLPERKTKGSAGYDMYVAEDILIPPYDVFYDNMMYTSGVELSSIDEPRTLEEIATITKSADAKVTLVSTGVKCKLPKNAYLKLVARSSLPLKHWIIVANSEGIIDSDYYNSPDNEGEIFFQLINLSPFPIILKKGDCIGQGIIQYYQTTVDDKVDAVRTGGFGSTNA